MSDTYSGHEARPREMEPAYHSEPNGPTFIAEEEFDIPAPGYPRVDKKSGDRGASVEVMQNVDEDEDAPRSRSCVLRTLDAITRFVHKVIPPGGILSSAFSLASGSIGAGILGLPGGSDTSGLALAMIYLVIITFFSVFSMHLLAVTTIKTNIKTFEGLGRWLFPWGNHAFSYWVAFIRWFYSFGACVGYVISIGDCFTPILEGALNRSEESKQNKALQYFNTTSGHRLLQSLVWLCVMLPLVVPKHIDSLRYASTFAVTMMTYFVIVIIVHSCLHGFPEHRHNVKVSGRRNTGPEGPAIFLFRTGNDATTALGVFMFAYVCQINALEVLLDMRPEIRTARNFTWAAFIGMMICGTLYVLVAVFGYFDFGSEQLQSNSILLMYKPFEDPYMMVAYVGVLCKLCVSYALLSMAARNSIYYVMGWQQKYQTPKHKRNPVMDGEGSHHHVEEDYLPGDSFGADPRDGNAGDDNNDNDERGASNSSDQPNSPVGGEAGKGDARKVKTEAVDDDVFVDNIPMWRHLIVVTALGVVCLMCGLFVPTIKIVFGFAGSVSGGFLAFIFPALFYMYAGNFSVKEQGPFLYYTTYALLIAGVVGVVFGTGATIYTTVGGK